MRRIAITIAAIAATLGISPAAHAAPICAGHTGIAYVCVDTAGPKVTCGGWALCPPR